MMDGVSLAAEIQHQTTDTATVRSRAACPMPLYLSPQSDSGQTVAWVVPALRPELGQESSAVLGHTMRAPCAALRCAGAGDPGCPGLPDGRHRRRVRGQQPGKWGTATWKVGDSNLVGAQGRPGVHRGDGVLLPGCRLVRGVDNAALFCALLMLWTVHGRRRASSPPPFSSGTRCLCPWAPRGAVRVSQ